MKKSAAEDQVLDLNRVDFERAGTGRKAGYKFIIEFTDGKVGNVISGSTLAMHLASVIMEDESAKQILRENNYEVSLNTKFQLSIKNTTIAPVSQPTPKKKGKEAAKEAKDESDD